MTGGELQLAGNYDWLGIVPTHQAGLGVWLDAYGVSIYLNAHLLHMQHTARSID